ncbi:thiamine biosynthesis lipoprotein [Pedobacter xixiisoli]|uniref:FAD:protein FMN transferase n=2 Tax=Pedobacter xixiisoli TaxID=1476464 RepID=A0A285ZQ99_9SPHI|nr:thiamine biosynthesis lipoprotein [Pedobacter xixiisoli]
MKPNSYNVLRLLLKLAMTFQRSSLRGTKQSLMLLSLFFYALQANAQVQCQRPVTLMGSRFDITIVAADSAKAEKHIDEVIAEMSRIEELISDWKASSQISEVNRNAGVKPVKVDREVFELTKRAIYFSKITEGAFDISYAAMDKIWKFDGSMKQMPTPEEIQKSVAKVGYQNIELDSVNSTIFLKLAGMKIGFGSTGKGYAADKGRELMESKGIKAGIVNASGDMTTWGVKPNGKAWNVGITNPFDEEKYIAIIPLKREAVTTSGNYEKYVEFNGKRYAHIINPVTGYPATGLISVTVIGPSAEKANGFSTSIMVLGKEKGLELIHLHPDYRCVIVTDEGEVVKSTNFKAKMKKKLK